jgi:virginiamycin B lyase
MRRRALLLAFGFMVLLSASLFYLSFVPFSSCGKMVGQAKITKFDLLDQHFDGVTKFRLPSDKFPNGITTISDGSVWFGEQNVPGLAHLYSNGTMLEYAWPFTYSPSTTSIWGVVQWNGRIWASDALGSQIVGLDPFTAAVYAVKLSEAAAFPYTITVGPDGALWFTELFVSKIGRIDSQCRLEEFALPQNFGGTPTQIGFENDTSGYYLDGGNVSTGLGTLLSFNPNQFSPQPIDGTFNLRAPSSLMVGSDGIWVAQHASSTVAYYSFRADDWVFYPTSPISYEDTTLPYFVATNGSQVWFNEHYANHMAVIDTEHSLLTEYSLSNPPASRIIGIDNALTFSLGGGKAWFTELTANYVGYVDASYKPTYKISQANSSSLKLKPGGNANLTFTVSGESHSPIMVLFADTENVTGRPQRILMTANVTEIQSLNGRETVLVNVTADRSLQIGDYTILVTFTDGLVNQGVYLKLHVTSQA